LIGFLSNSSVFGWMAMGAERSGAARMAGGGTGGLYLDLVTAGCGFAVACEAGDGVEARAWLAARGVRYFESRGLFGFRKRNDALNFAARFSPGGDIR
jgi:hypothetical protein